LWICCALVERLNLYVCEVRGDLLYTGAIGLGRHDDWACGLSKE
jgi:hypothetical protein